MDINGRLKDLGITIPKAPPPAANYVPYQIMGNQVIVSGQIPFVEGGLLTGKLGDNYTLEQGVEAAKTCILNVLAQVQEACDGDLSKVDKCIKIGVFVNSTPDYIDQPKVANGASDLLLEIFGANGKHARAAVGVASLPLGSAVEIEAIFTLK